MKSQVHLKYNIENIKNLPDAVDSIDTECTDLDNVDMDRMDRWVQGDCSGGQEDQGKLWMACMDSDEEKSGVAGGLGRRGEAGKV